MSGVHIWLDSNIEGDCRKEPVIQSVTEVATKKYIANSYDYEISVSGMSPMDLLVNILESGRIYLSKPSAALMEVKGEYYSLVCLLEMCEKNVLDKFVKSW